MSKPKTCRECGAPFTPRPHNAVGGCRHGDRSTQDFCGVVCRKDFNNRRAMRGAELYDLFRAMRREREAAREMNLWTSICRLEEKWQEDDDRERPGRRSYAPPQEALMKLVDTGKIGRHLTPAQEAEDRAKRRAKTAAHYAEVTP